MTAVDTDEAAFLAAIRANPADDLPRLVYADWLDERAGELPCPDAEYHGRNRECRGCGDVYVHIHKYSGCDACEGEESHPIACPTCKGTGRVSNGNAERAEFIRLQIELLQMPGSPNLDDRREAVRVRLNTMIDGGLVGLWSGFGADWTWSGDEMGPMLEKRSHLIESGGVIHGWRRGFISDLRGPLQSCLDHLPALVRHPAAVVTRVRVTDREPYNPEPDDWRWYRENHGPQLQCDIRGDVFDMIREPFGDGWCWKTFRTRELADAALSDALLAWARSQPAS